MKIKTTIYANLLLESLKDKPNLKKLAANFWNLVQKNKQYKELPKILDELEQLYAEKNGAKIAYVESGKELDKEELEEIKNRLSTVIASHRVEREARQSNEKIAEPVPSRTRDLAPRNDNIILKTKFNPSLTGVLAKIDDKVIDLSVENKILRLQKTINR